MAAVGKQDGGREAYDSGRMILVRSVTPIFAVAALLALTVSFAQADFAGTPDHARYESALNGGGYHARRVSWDVRAKDDTPSVTSSDLAQAGGSWGAGLSGVGSEDFPGYRPDLDLPTGPDGLGGSLGGDLAEAGARWGGALGGGTSEDFTGTSPDLSVPTGLEGLRVSFADDPAPVADAATVGPNGPQQAWIAAFDEYQRTGGGYDVATAADFQMTSDTSAGTPEPASLLLGLCAFGATLGRCFVAAARGSRRRHHSR